VHYVIFYVFDIPVKFCSDCFIGCQDICENALYWLMLEVLVKSGFGGINGGAVDPSNKMIP